MLIIINIFPKATITVQTPCIYFIYIAVPRYTYLSIGRLHLIATYCIGRRKRRRGGKSQKKKKKNHPFYRIYPISVCKLFSLLVYSYIIVFYVLFTILADYMRFVYSYNIILTCDVFRKKFA